jgi:hypothetical protein
VVPSFLNGHDFPRRTLVLDALAKLGQAVDIANLAALPEPEDHLCAHLTRLAFRRRPATRRMTRRRVSCYLDGEFLLFCPEYGKREFAPDARASDLVPLVHRRAATNST